MADPIQVQTDVDIEIQHYQLRKESITVTSDGTTPVDITGAEIILSVKDTFGPGGTLLVRKRVSTGGIVITDAVNGVFEYTILPGDQEILVPNVYFYDIFILNIPNANDQYPVIEPSKFKILGSVFERGQENISTTTLDDAGEDHLELNTAGGAPELQNVRQGAYSELSTITAAANISLDGDLSNNFSLDLAGTAVTIDSFLDTAPGQIFSIRITDTTGGGSLTFPASALFPAGTAPTGPGTLNQIDVLSCYVTAVDGSNVATEVLVMFNENFS
jgi:hypothetical protein